MRVALVTGASKNIGLAISEELVRAGCAVALLGRDEDAVGRAASDLAAAGATVLPVVADVRRPDQIQAAVAAVRTAWGRVDILVNNAGVRAHGPIASTRIEDWQAVIDTVLTGSLLTTQAVFAGMCEAGWGRIINIAGISGEAGASDRPAVVAAKSGLMGLTRATAHEGAAAGVTANAVSPGFIDTDRSPTLGDASIARRFYEGGAQRTPVKRAGLPSEVAALCGFLCSDQAGFITGQTYSINGGSRM